MTQDTYPMLHVWQQFFVILAAVVSEMSSYEVARTTSPHQLVRPNRPQPHVRQDLGHTPGERLAHQPHAQPLTWPRRSVGAERRMVHEDRDLIKQTQKRYVYRTGTYFRETSQRSHQRAHTHTAETTIFFAHTCTKASYQANYNYPHV